MLCILCSIVVLLMPLLANVNANHCTFSKKLNAPFAVSYPSFMFESPYDTASVQTYNCSSGGVLPANVSAQCLADSHVACPVRTENIQSALCAASWLQYAEALRRIAEAHQQQRAHFVNVFYVGGSMTHGSDTNCWCVCSQEFDSRCPLPTDTCHISRCSWTTHLSAWLTREYPSIKFAFHDFSSSGRSMLRAVSVFGPLLLESKANLTSNDIVFLDHSVNDAQGTYKGLEMNMERVVRTILLTSARHYAARPTIIVVEQYAHKTSRYLNMHPIPVAHASNDPTDYAYIYRKVSEHYSLVLFSMREVFWTYYGPPGNRNITDPSNVATRLYPFSPYLRSVHGRAHVPYFIHTYMSDVFANIISHSVKHLFNEGEGANSSIHAHQHSIRMLPHTTNITLPQAMNDLSSSSSACDTMVPYVLRERANGTVQPDNVTLYETDPVGAAAGWRDYVDHHEVAGWIINDLSSKHHRDLTFALTEPPAHHTYEGMTLQLAYLRSYEGMGRVRMYLCGKRLQWPDSDAEGYLDSLQTAGDHVSIPFTVLRQLTDEDDKRCQAAALTERVVRFEYAPGDDNTTLRAVHHSKFKLLSVEICTPLRLE